LPFGTPGKACPGPLKSLHASCMYVLRTVVVNRRSRRVAQVGRRPCDWRLVLHGVPSRCTARPISHCRFLEACVPAQHYTPPYPPSTRNLQFHHGVLHRRCGLGARSRAQRAAGVTHVGAGRHAENAVVMGGETCSRTGIKRKSLQVPAGRRRVGKAVVVVDVRRAGKESTRPKHGGSPCGLAETC
jgi:hypothetical protein